MIEHGHGHERTSSYIVFDARICYICYIFFQLIFPTNSNHSSLGRLNIYLRRLNNVKQLLTYLPVLHAKFKPYSLIHTSFSIIGLSSVISCIVSCEMVYTELLFGNCVYGHKMLWESKPKSH
jgi:E3 ubiquitin-protein ligase DOA10